MKVLSMTQVETIKNLYENEGRSLREIATKTGHHFTTVQKYAYQSDWNQPKEPAMQNKEFPTVQEHIPVINQWLEQDTKVPRKQRHTATRIFNRLKKEYSYKGSYHTLRRYVNYRRAEIKQYKETFLPLAHPPAYAQVDFGKFQYRDALGRDCKGFALVVSFPYSNAGWIQVFKGENQECLLIGLLLIFYHIGGVPIRVRCDNMTTAVAQILKGTERVITEGFSRFMLHHRFEADFCNPNSGNEKGNVENKVGYTRRNMLVPVPVITDFEAFNKELLALCDADHAREHYAHGKTIQELWDEEKEFLLALPEYKYDVFRYESLTVSKTGFIMIDKVRYGLAPEMGGKIVQAKIGFDKIDVFHERSLIKSYSRNYGGGGEETDWKDYLQSLIKKPGATEHTRIFGQMPEQWRIYLSGVKGSEKKAALTLLSEIVSEGNEAMCDDVLELAAQYGPFDIDNIRQCYMFISKPEKHPLPLKLASSPPLLNYVPNLSAYDGIYSTNPVESPATGGAVK